MNEADALLAAVLAEPHDDTPRLVYADWLDEHGQPERAEFIRVQVELARNPTLALQSREVALFFLHGDRWLAPLKAPGRPLDGESHGAFRRGFVEVVWMTAARFLDRAAALFASAPVRELRVTRTTRDDLARLLASPFLARLDCLDLSDRRLGDPAVFGVAGAETVRGLRSLRLRGCGFTHSGAMALANSPFLSGLRFLDVSHNSLSPVAVSALRQRFGEGVIAEGTTR